MRIRSIRAAAKEIQERDPQTAIKACTLYRLVKEGVVHSTRVGRTILVDVDCLDNYLAAARSEGVAVSGAVRPVEVRQ